MDVTVEFLGLCLFAGRSCGGDPMTVLLPEASESRHHLDHPNSGCNGDSAKEHYAYLFVPEDDVADFGGAGVDLADGRVQARLRGMECTVVAEPRESSLDISGLAPVVDLRKFTENLKRRGGDDDLAARMPIPWGSFSTELTPSDIGGWEFLETLKPNHGYSPDRLAWRVEWHFQAEGSVELRLEPIAAGAGGQIVLKSQGESGPRITIGNVCEEDPGVWDDLTVEECKDPDGCPDLDFKWLYRLFQPATGGPWNNFLAGECLPVPKLIPKKKAGASTPTCFPCQC